MLFTVIVVTYNAEKYLDATLQSLMIQKCNDYDVVAVDGKSVDNTLAILHKYQNEFRSIDVDFQIVSEKDTGIYNAMNKGIKKAKGEYLYFLNAGDELYDENVFEKVKDIIKSGRKSVYYGDTFCINDNLIKIWKGQPIDTIVKDIPFCHQSVFVKREDMSMYGFDEKYQIGADYDFFLKLYFNHAEFVYMDTVISKYMLNGYSLHDDGLFFWNERFEIRKKWLHWSRKQIVYEYILTRIEIAKMKIARIIKTVFPKRLVLIIRLLHGKKEGWILEDEA